MALIDWHDFQVVETIDFLDEEDDELPAPLALRDVIAQLRDAEMAHGGESAGLERETLRRRMGTWRWTRRNRR